jgi:hypothetical protein
MSTSQRDWISKWTPLLFSITVNVIWVGYTYGRYEQRMIPVESHIMSETHEKLSEKFVLRNEFNLRTTQRDRELATLGERLLRIEDKLDRLLERK